MKKVFVNGVFDLLHLGHVRLLRRAKTKGDYLIVAINSDASVKRLKGPERPITNQNERKELLEALECVDEVIVFKEDNPLKLIGKLRPDIVVKGPGWKNSQALKNDQDLVKSYGGKFVVLKKLSEWSTTNIIKKLNAESK